MDASYSEEILSKISGIIESKTVQGNEVVIDFQKFKNDKEDYTRKVKSMNHFGENDWPNCVEKICYSLKPLQDSYDSCIEANDVGEDFTSSQNNTRQVKSLIISNSLWILL